MKINELHIINLRNHSQSSIEFGRNVNVIRGLNGSGKTTILEALSISSLSKTFLPTLDSALITSGESSYKINITALSDVEVGYKVSIEYQAGGRKKINSSIGENLNPKDILGIVPLVILSPDFKSLTFGSPQDKRQFLDTVLSQSSRQYVDESLKYKKYLKQRNALLSQNLREGKFNRDYFEILTDMFMKSASEIIFRRINFIKDFESIFIDSYTSVSNNQEIPGIKYLPDSIKLIEDLSKADIKILLETKYKSIINIEMKRGSTLFGPQRDDLTFTVNNLNSKDSASQGQHKSLLISIKLSEFEFLKNILNETPVILFDDIFSELDIERSSSVFSKIMENDAQTIITMTNSERLINKFDTNASYFNVDKGNVRKSNAQ
ncbi:MAG: DNA replication and repair protein RecF [Candidatus Kapabacteria bacterium]|nr:DNA replication and repair protein RecF [Candidatus Kapabacteria bacterium]